MVPRTEAMPESSIYRIVFHSQGQIYEIYARQVAQGNLFGFVEVEELVFGEKTRVVIDPSEERLKNEFDGVRRTFLPMHAIVRIDEVEREGSAKITAAAEGAASVMPFPFPARPPRGGGKES